MTFPLIQQPAPLQQLAETLAQIRAQGEARQNARLNRRATEQQIVSAKAADLARQDSLTLERERNTDMRKAAELAEQNRNAALALDQAQFQATVQQNAIQNRRNQMQGKLQMMQLVASLLPEGVSVSLPRLQSEAAGRRYLPGVGQAPTTLEADIAAAQAGSRPGMQGSAVRNRQLGTSNGVTFDPGTVNYNAPSGGRGGGLGHIAERTAIGAGLLERVVQRANLLYGQNVRNVAVPATGDVGAAVVERVLGHGAGGRVADRVRNFGATQGQREFRGLREQFKHSMAVFFPRVSIALMENLADSYFPVAGETGPSAAAKMAALNDVFRVVQEVRAGRLGHAALAQALAARTGDAGQAFLDEAANDGATTTASPVIPHRFQR